MKKFGYKCIYNLGDSFSVKHYIFSGSDKMFLHELGRYKIISSDERGGGTLVPLYPTGRPALTIHRVDKKWIVTYHFLDSVIITCGSFVILLIMSFLEGAESVGMFQKGFLLLLVFFGLAFVWWDGVRYSLRINKEFKVLESRVERVSPVI